MSVNIIFAKFDAQVIWSHCGVLNIAVTAFNLNEVDAPRVLSLGTVDYQSIYPFVISLVHLLPAALQAYLHDPLHRQDTLRFRYVVFFRH
jgi:hypothetical protein